MTICNRPDVERKLPVFTKYFAFLAPLYYTLKGTLDPTKDQNE
jgi:hypothetical protein